MARLQNDSVIDRWTRGVEANANALRENHGFGGFGFFGALKKPEPFLRTSGEGDQANLPLFLAPL
jgi:hypothetical protein